MSTQSRKGADSRAFRGPAVQRHSASRNSRGRGIDPRPEELPAGFLERFPADRDGVTEALRRFGCDVIDVVSPLVAAVKFQSAFYEAYGPAGYAALHATVAHARRKA